MDPKAILLEMREGVENDLGQNILPYWLSRAADRRNGGVYGLVDMLARPDQSADKALVITARTVWTFARAYAWMPVPAYRQMAEQAYDFLMDNFLDRANKGYYWMVSAAGEPVNDRKHVYGQAFVIYALSEYHRVFSSPAALSAAQDLWRLLGEAFLDRERGGYVECLARDLTRTSDMRMVPDDSSAEKTMNSHLHILEAFTNLYSVWPADEMEQSLRDMIEIMSNRILDRSRWHYNLYFDASWKALERVDSYGHDIEGSWLMLEAAEALGDKTVIADMKNVAVRMAEVCLREAFDGEPGMRGENIDNYGLLASDRCWWVQAEAVVGFLNAYEVSGNDEFLKTASGIWRYIDERFVDRGNGEWYSSLAQDGRVYLEPTVTAWKCPYHNSRMAIEVMRRVDLLLAEKPGKP